MNATNQALLEQLLDIRKRQLEQELRAIYLSEHAARQEEKQLATINRLLDAKAAFSLTWEQLSDELLTSVSMLKAVVARQREFSSEKLEEVNEQLDKLFNKSKA